MGVTQDRAWPVWPETVLGRSNLSMSDLFFVSILGPILTTHWTHAQDADPSVRVAAPGDELANVRYSLIWEPASVIPPFLRQECLCLLALLNNHFLFQIPPKFWVSIDFENRHNAQGNFYASFQKKLDTTPCQF